MMAAGIAAFLCHLLKQPKILGYIIAGLIIGPHTPFWSVIDNDMSILTLADIGIIFLMFCMGFEFNLRKLSVVGVPAFVTACADVIVTFWLGLMTGRMLGWSGMECIFLGAIICTCSTTVASRMLNELGHSKERYASIIMGAAIVEDLAAVTLIAVLTGIGITGAVQTEGVMLRIGELVTFLVVTIIAGFTILRPVINYIARFKNDELLLMIALGTCFTASLMAVKLEFSLALGAFIVGAVISESKPADRIALFSQPIRDIFAPMFFVSIGMLIDPVVVVQQIWPIVVITVVVVFGKLAASSFGAFASGNDRETSFKTGAGMAQICEFALIIAALGRTLHITGDHVYSIAVTVSVATIFINPHILKRTDILFAFFERFTPKPVAGAMTFYTRWLRNAARGRANDPVRKIVRRSLITIAVNLAIITAVFIVVTILSRYDYKLPFEMPQYLGGTKAFLWLIASLLAVPLYVATIRKWEAMSMVAAEMKFPMIQGNTHNAIARTLSQKVIMFAGIAVLAVYTIMLSSALLPSFHVLVIMMIIIAGITALLWKFQIKLYSRAQSLVMETFAGDAEPVFVEPLTAMPYLFREASLLSVDITSGLPSVGETVKGLGIRARTGATIIGIRRGEDMITNPPLDELIREGDKILLLGLHGQLDAARNLLEGKP